MDEYLKIHKALSEAEVEYQKKFDASKKFYDDLIASGLITDPVNTLKDMERLEKEEQDAYEKRKAAQRTYKEYLKRKH